MAASSTARDGAPDDGAAPTDGYPVTIEYAHGSTTIDQPPATNVQWTDALLAMGKQPAGYVLDGASGESEPYPWHAGLLAILPNDGDPHELAAGRGGSLTLLLRSAPRPPPSRDQAAALGSGPGSPPATVVANRGR